VCGEVVREGGEGLGGWEYRAWGRDSGGEVGRG